MTLEDLDKPVNRPLFTIIPEEERRIPKFTNIDEDNYWFLDYEEPKAYHKDCGLNQLIDPNNMYKMFKKCNQGSSWKMSNKKYEVRSLTKNRETAVKIMNGTYKQDKANEFTLCERGHIRRIQPHKIKDRIVQATLNEYYLLPTLIPHLISDNAASQLGKGLDYQRERFEKHLMQAYREYGPNEGYVLFIDFSKYFDNLSHQVLLDIFNKYFDPIVVQFIKDRLDEFNVDVAYMSEEEFQNCMDSIFNSLEYSQIPLNLRNKGEKFMEKSVGIGSQTSQIAGLIGVNDVDHYCKTVKSIKYYGRYMDDTYIMARTKEELQSLLNNELLPMYDKLKVHVNKKKTQIHRLSNTLCFLKINYKIQNDILIRKPVQETFHREYRRLTKFKHNPIISREDIINCYKSWRGSYIKYNCKDEIEKLDNYFFSLFDATGADLINITNEDRRKNRKARKKSSRLNRMRNKMIHNHKS